MWHWAGHVGGAERDPSIGVTEVPALAERFDAQGEAETWLGEHYPELVEAGVAAVSLFEEDRLVYGPMSLSA